VTDIVAQSTAEDDATLTSVLLPRAALMAWLADHVPQIAADATITRVTAGMSNELFEIVSGDEGVLLRRGPRVPVVRGAHDVVREARILAALAYSAVPHPAVVAVCGEPEVIGVPFFLMRRVPGHNIYADRVPPEWRSPDNQRAVATGLVDALAALVEYDWAAGDLADLGRPEGYTQRQVGRWMTQLRSYAARPLPDLDAAAEMLAARVPTMQPASLLHGDYGLHNVLFAPQLPPVVTAVLDWETATIGDPLVDLGYLLGMVLTEDERERWSASAPPYSTAAGATRDELAERFAVRTGLDVAGLDWYRALGRFKLAVILEGAYVRHLQGAGDTPAAELAETVPELAAHALAILCGTA
jgi:aminoglycoside phosphotransferase (APT) family kinase protein